MDDFYQLLGFGMGDNLQHIRSTLRKEMLLCHPDKCQSLSANEQAEKRDRYDVLHRAWRVFGDDDKRRRYNAVLQQAKLQENSARRPVQAEVAFSDFSGAPSTDYHSVDPEEVFEHPCRCGGAYIIEGVAVLGRMPYAYCCQCSLAVKVVYPDDLRASFSNSIPQINRNRDLRSTFYKETNNKSSEQGHDSINPSQQECAPFHLPAEVSKETKKRKAVCLKTALAIVERCGQNPITCEMVASVLPWLEREQYDDIPVERVAYGNCGYLLCLKPVGNQLKQTYRISSASRKVYEVGDRKYFCSDWCYRASCYLRMQIPAEPAWCRPLNPGPMVNLRFLPPTAHGLPGKKILDAMNRMRLDDSNDESGSGESDSVGSDNDSSFDEGEEDIPEDVDEAFGRVVKIDHTKLPKNVCASKAQIRKMWSEPLPPPKNIKIIERKPSSLELPQVPTSEQFTATPQRPSSPTGDLATFVTTRLSEWITPEAIRALGSETEPSAAELEKLPKPVKFEKVAAFLRGSEPSSFDPETDPASDHPLGSTVMPLVDSISQKQYRLRLLLESLLPSLKSILFRLALPLSDVFENLQNFVAHFSLTNRNLHLKPEEALLTSAALLYLLRTYVICLRTEDDSLERLSAIVSGLGVDAKKFFASLENIVAQLKSTPEDDLPD